MTFSWTGRDTFSSFDAISKSPGWNGKFYFFIVFYTYTGTWIEKNGSPASFYCIGICKYMSFLLLLLNFLLVLLTNMRIWLGPTKNAYWSGVPSLLQRGTWAQVEHLDWILKQLPLQLVSGTWVNKALHPYQAFCKMRV